MCVPRFISGMLFRPLVSLSLLLGISLSVPVRAQQPATQIFFGTIDTITGRDMKRPNPGVYMDFFKPDAPWQRGAAKVDFFQISTQFVLSSTDEDLVALFTDLKRRHLSVSLSMGASQREPGCGAGEGYLPSEMVDVVGRRLTRHGFKIDVWEMDEPIWFAHEVNWGKENGQIPCHYPLPKLIQQVAATVKHMRTYFPDIKVGDIEVIADYADRPGFTIQGVVQDYVEFSHLFKAATGIPLAFFHADIAWRTNWRPAYVLAARAFRAEGMRFGAVIGGSPADVSDQAFVNTGIQRLRELQSSPVTRMDDVLVESWQPRPSRFLPETEPGTSANLLLRTVQIVKP